jgi:putative redox protein
MPPEVVRLDWTTGQEFILRDRFDFPIVMTQPAGVNGADLLPLSVIGCSAWDIIAILLKQKQQVQRFSVQAASQREIESPWRFLAIHITYRFTGTNLDEAKIRRAISLTEDKYCSTYATLRQAVKLTSEFEIIAAETLRGSE